MMYGDDADDLGGETDEAWVNIAPGVAVEIRYELAEYRIQGEDGQVPGRLTGRVMMARKVVFESQWGPGLAVNDPGE